MGIENYQLKRKQKQCHYLVIIIVQNKAVILYVVNVLQKCVSNTGIMWKFKFQYWCKRVFLNFAFGKDKCLQFN